MPSYSVAGIDRDRGLKPALSGDRRARQELIGSKDKGGACLRSSSKAKRPPTDRRRYRACRWPGGIVAVAAKADSSGSELHIAAVWTERVLAIA
jgi:hypothetical protein